MVKAKTTTKTLFQSGILITDIAVPAQRICVEMS